MIDFSYMLKQGQIYKYGDAEQKYFWGPPHPQTKNCGWLIDWSIVVSWIDEYGLMASC